MNQVDAYAPALGEARRHFHGPAFPDAFRRIGVIVVLVLIALPGWRPLLDPRFFHSQDGFEHAFRILSIATALPHGDLLPRWVPELAGGFGYAMFAVYGPLSYYLPAVLSLAGTTVFDAMKLFIAMLCLASAAAAYLTLRLWTGRLPALAGAAAYACAPYTMINAYVRADIAELSTFPLTALTVAAILRLERRLEACESRSMRYVWPRVAGVAVPLSLVPATHTLSLATFLPTLLTLLAYTCVSAARRGGSRLLFAAVVTGGSCVLAALLAAWFLLPALVWQRWLQISAIPNDIHFVPKLIDVPLLVAGFTNHQPWAWFSTDGTWWFLSLAPGRSGELPAFPAYLTLVAGASTAVIAWVRKSQLRGVILAMALALLLTGFFETRWSSWLWNAEPRLTLLQFPWRFLGPLSLDAALLAGLGIGALPRRLSSVIACLVIVGSVAPALSVARPVFLTFGDQAVTWPSQLRRELIGGIGTTGNGLFLPKEVTTQVPGKPAASSAALPNPAGAFDVQAVAFGQHTIMLRYTSDQAQTLTVARLYVPAWNAEIDGRSSPLLAQPDTGLLQFHLPAGRHTLVARLRPTWAEYVGGFISLVALSVLAGGLTWALVAPGQRGEQGSTSRTLIRDRRFWRRVVAGVGISTVAGALALFSSRPESVAPLSLPAQGGDAAIRVTGWRFSREPGWGALPTIHVVLWTASRVTEDDDLVVRLTAPDGHVVAEARHRPRLGMYQTAGWPGGLMVDDRLLLPGAADTCGGSYQASVGLAAHGSNAEPASPQRLGSITVPMIGGATCTPLTNPFPSAPAFQIRSYQIAGATTGPFPKLISPRSIDVSLRLRAGRPTSDDEVIDVQLADSAGKVVSEQRSTGKDDLIFTALWRAGDVVVYDTTLPVPHDSAPGIYHLRAGLFNRDRQAFDLVQGPGLAPPASSPQEMGTVVFLPQPLPPIPTVATFGAILGLEEARIDRTVGLRPDVRIAVTTRWRLLGATAESYTLFAQILDQSGRLVAQADGLPVGGQYPTSAWSPGETVVDQRDLTIPETALPGRYRLIVGWYLFANGTRLTVQPPQPANAYPIVDLTIGT